MNNMFSYVRLAKAAGALMLITSCSKQAVDPIAPAKQDDEVTTLAAAAVINVPLGGNAYITQKDAGAAEVIASYGLANWTSANTITSTYFRLGNTGQLTVAVKAKVPSGTSSIRVTVNGTPFTLSGLTGKNAQTYTAGTVSITAAGYVKVDLQGISKTGGYFADVSDLVISGSATNSNVLYANDAANYYWSRRGPSVHLGYSAPANTEWFYNEVTVPTGEDKIGSYFMSNGFNGGYFGIQVNSSTERRVLFSVWDPSVGKTTMVRKGPNVVDNTFGGEGTGGQSYLVFNWQAGTTYKFLTQGKPDGAGATVFSSWIYTPETSAWRFIASWKQPNTTTYLAGLYSFLENFNPEYGWQGRKAFYQNQWARNVSGTWSEIVNTNFTADATAQNQQRKDYAGGVENGKFFLRNCGFFANFVNYNTPFTRPATGQQPAVNLNTLP
ncbi:DUF5077 domain-containing protein [Paraflavitalea sp. CAU 1676]|uniref:DUF3472 domain-containing protein n=1 Tax=Paraflavitalea sp. CAU 1676 TaxID=3032598 RepID=UPI0023D99C18|nr:DUF5077 domain-containing protein [Paraflavitalea sp. CAU 1676]MDF2188557.1 DUF5077 domain-containing protein [Paraflavitalea sp. CAU 1676]